MLATDRDLLVHEPNLFRELGWASQRLVKATGAISGTTLTISAYDVDLANAGVAAGHVVVIDGAPLEVVERLSATTATVSRLRADPAGPAIAPSPMSNKPVTIATFAPQVALVRDQVLRLLGLEPPDESRVTNPDALRRLVALGALHLAYTAASAAGGEQGWSSRTWSRGQFYLQRFADERERVEARLDLDGDGIADACRRLNVAQLVRD
ncbi:MAG: hypothetical protein JNM80_12435 [Phycisphaerae bacterium]|nr:hypothetical protein [Phycisphaerae bacterium]